MGVHHSRLGVRCAAASSGTGGLVGAEDDRLQRLLTVRRQLHDALHILHPVLASEASEKCELSEGLQDLSTGVRSDILRGDGQVLRLRREASDTSGMCLEAR